MNSHNIMIQCSCGVIVPFHRAYFCRACLAFRCVVCAEKEIISCYCNNCFTTISSTMLHFKKGKCSICYDCPICSNHLTLHMKKSRLKQKLGQTTVENNSFYLTCSFCLWSTHDINFPDQNKISSFYFDPENERIPLLIQYYQKLCWNRSESSYKKFRNSNSLMYRYPVSQKAAELRLNTVSLLTKICPLNSPDVKPSIAEENQEVLPKDIFNTAADLSSSTYVQQRLADPNVQPSKILDLKPIRRHLVTKNVFKCLECNHNLRIPENEGVRNYFKVNRNCNYYTPSVKVVRCEPLRYDCISELILEVINCFNYNVSINFFQNFDLPKDILRNSLKMTVDVITFPRVPLLLPPKTVNFEPSSSRGVQVKFLVQPSIVASVRDDAIFSFIMRYSYLNNNSLVTEIVKLDCKFFINLGKLEVL